MIEITTHSVSNAEDLGYEALNDLATAAGESNYRVVGGHMVQMLLHVYPTPRAVMRTTGDADAGIERATAAGQDLHHALLAQGYIASAGNTYVKPDGESQRSVDLLVEHGTPGKSVVINGRSFDPIPGLTLAIAAPPLLVKATVHLLSGGVRVFTIPLPDVECALVLKALSWKSRMAAKDAADICSLLEIALEHREKLYSPWNMKDPVMAGMGTRKDAVAALHKMVPIIGRGALDLGPGKKATPRLAALIRQLIHDPETT